MALRRCLVNTFRKTNINHGNISVAFANNFSSSSSSPSPPKRPLGPIFPKSSLMSKISGGTNTDGEVELWEISRRLNTHAQNGQFKEAIDILNTMKETYKLRPTSLVCAIVIDACNTAGEYQKSIDIYDNCKKLYGVTPEEDMYAAVFEACLDSLNWQQSLRILEELNNNKNDIKPRVDSYNIVILTCYKGGNWIKVVEIVDKMIAKDGFLMTKGYRIPPPDAVGFNTSIIACMQLKELEKSISLIRKAFQSGFPPYINTISTIMKTCQLQGDWKLCIQILEIILEKIELKNNPEQAIDFNDIRKIAKLCCEEQKITSKHIETDFNEEVANYVFS